MKLNEALYGAKRSAIREFSELAGRTPGCVALTLGEPDFATPQPICSAVTDALTAGQTHYIDNNGTRALREAVARFEQEKNGMDYTPDEVILTAGATEALFIALFGILNPGDEVIVPTPAFVLYEQIIGLCRGRYVPYDTAPDGFQLNAKRLESLITPRTKAILLNSPNNPTGCIYNLQSLKDVHDTVQGRDIFVICDDVYRQLDYTGSYHSFAEFRNLRQQILLVQSFSKPYAMTGWRMGYLLSDASIKERLALLHQFMVVSTPAPFQTACIRALDCDITPMLEIYRTRRDYVLRRLQQMQLPACSPDGAFYVFPSIQEFGLSSSEFCVRMIREAGLAATPGSCFGAEGYIRLTYCYGNDQLHEGLDRLERFICMLRTKGENE